MEPFDHPIYVTRPVLPDLDLFNDKLKKIWDSKWLTNMGDHHNELEVKLKNFLNVPELSLFNNGTIALIVALKVLGIEGEVITTPFTFPATVHALRWNGIKPVFCDIDPITLNINSDKLEELITPETKGLLPVHVFGTPCDVDKIQKIAEKHNLKTVYDAAHAFGVEIDGESIGNAGDISMFSFHATKLFHTAEGGALTYKSSDLERVIYYAKNFGIKNEEEVMMTGINGKMPELEAALGLCVLEMIEDEIQKRRDLMELYIELLSDIEGIRVRSIPEVSKFNYQYFYILIDVEEFGLSRNEVHEKLLEYNVYTRKYFYPLCSNYSCYSSFPSSSPDLLPVANKVANEILVMPLYGDLTDVDVRKICGIVRSFKQSI